MSWDAWGEAWGAPTVAVAGTGSCASGVCGTGGWSGPLPGDPDNNAILTATPMYGGIEIAWTYPTINPQAVSHVLLYRGTLNNLDLAIRYAVVSGDRFFDRIGAAERKEYFYWIYVVSVNGTVGTVIGPASAVPMLSIEETIIDLTGKIDAGVLAESLRSEIGRIEVINQHLLQEVDDRVTDVTTVTNALSNVLADGEEVRALLQQEVQLRIDTNEAFASSVNAAQVNLGNNIATAKTTLQTNINTVNGKVASIGALYTAKVDVNGLIGGFGIYNDGTYVEAGFDVDRFWVGKTTNKIKPFIIDSGKVYINEAVINKLTFSKLRDDSGAFVVQNGKLNAQYIDAENLTAKHISTSNGHLTITDSTICVYDEAGTLRVKLGQL